MARTALAQNCIVPSLAAISQFPLWLAAWEGAPLLFQISPAFRFNIYLNTVANSCLIFDLKNVEKKRPPLLKKRNISKI